MEIVVLWHRQQSVEVHNQGVHGNEAKEPVYIEIGGNRITKLLFVAMIDEMGEVHHASGLHGRRCVVWPVKWRIKPPVITVELHAGYTFRFH